MFVVIITHNLAHARGYFPLFAVLHPFFYLSPFNCLILISPFDRLCLSNSCLLLCLPMSQELSEYEVLVQTQLH